jgi:hypothetical protein
MLSTGAVSTDGVCCLNEGGTRSGMVVIHCQAHNPQSQGTHACTQPWSWQDLQSCSGTEHTDAGGSPWSDSLLAGLAVGDLLLCDGMRGACSPKLDHPAARAAEQHGAGEGRSHHPGCSMLQDNVRTTVLSVS